jgi:malonyl-CoA O-methyltransferase
MHTKTIIPCYKQEVAKSFNRAASTYDDFSQFQANVLMRLVGMSPAIKSNISLDLGCGTGNAAAFLGPISQNLIHLDLSENMLKKAQKKSPKSGSVCADAEALPFQGTIFDLVFSSLSIQWCENLDAIGSEIERVLKPGGHFVVSTLSQDSMPELAHCWQQVDGHTHINHYPSYEALISQIRVAGLQLEKSRCEPLTMWFDSAKSAIDSLKKVGASVLVEEDERHVVTPFMWRRFLSEYEKLRTEKGIPLTYQVVYLHLKKEHRVN